jgi:hypothetical protein
VFRSSSPSAEGASSFAWIPRYPGATLLNIRSQQTAALLTYGFEFQTADAPASVAEFFDQRLRAAALSLTTRSPGAEETNLHGESSDGKRQIDVGIEKAPAGSTVIVTATEK